MNKILSDAGAATVHQTQETIAKEQAQAKARSIVAFIDPGALLAVDSREPESLGLVVNCLMQFYHRGAVDALDTLKARMR